MTSHFDSFTHFAKNTLILAQEEMRRLGDHQVQTQHLLLGILRQPKSLAGAILRNFGVTYETAYRLAEESQRPAGSADDQHRRVRRDGRGRIVADAPGLGAREEGRARAGRARARDARDRKNRGSRGQVRRHSVASRSVGERVTRPRGKTTD